MGYYWKCPDGHTSSWGDDEDPREWGGCTYCGKTGEEDNDADISPSGSGGVRE